MLNSEALLHNDLRPDFVNMLVTFRVSVSVLTIKYCDCKLVELGIVAEITCGQVGTIYKIQFFNLFSLPETAG